MGEMAAMVEVEDESLTYIPAGILAEQDMRRKAGG